MQNNDNGYYNLSSSKEGGMFSGTFILVIFIFILCVFGLFLWNFNLKKEFDVSNKKVIVLTEEKDKLTSKDLESSKKILELEEIKQKLEGISKLNERELSQFKNNLELTDKDLKDRIKTIKTLKDSFDKEKAKTENLNVEISKLKKEYESVKKTLEEENKKNKNISLSLELEKEQSQNHNSQINKLKEDVKASKDLYNSLNKKYLENIDYIDVLEKENKSLKFEINSLKTQKVKTNIENVMDSIE